MIKIITKLMKKKIKMKKVFILVLQFVEERIWSLLKLRIEAIMIIDLIFIA